jgi:hypothetical protein
MKINYQILKELNEQALTSSGEQMSCYWIIQSGIEKLIHNDIISDIQQNLLLELGVIEESENEINRRNIVGPFKFSEDGSTNS